MKKEALLPLVVFALACEPSVDRPDGGVGAFLDSRGATPPPDTPIVQPLPERIPYTIATIRGTAENAAHIIVFEGTRNPIAADVLPDGSFCVDARLPQPGAYQFSVLALGADDQASDQRAETMTTFDPSAPAIPGAQTCSGADPAGCPAAVEDCFNGRDDNCNNLVDGEDPACAECVDDLFEPNDELTAPRIDPGRYENLVICPGNQDVYGIYAESGEQIVARTFFSHLDANIDMSLLAQDRMTVLERSMSATDDELITYTATVAGEYKLIVYAPEDATTTYILDLRVEAPM